MNREIFIKRKEELSTLINNYLIKDNLAKQEESALVKLLELLTQYSFENRFDKKGLLSHTIIDSLELDYSFGEKFIKFDNDIK